MAMIDGVKERLLIQDASTDTEVLAALNEGLLYVEKAINKYDSTFVLATITENSFLWGVASDLGAGIFKRRHMPEDMDTGWWQQGLKKLDTYIQTEFMPVQEGKIHFAVMDTTPEFEVGNTIWIGTLPSTDTKWLIDRIHTKAKTYDLTETTTSEIRLGQSWAKIDATHKIV